MDRIHIGPVAYPLANSWLRVGQSYAWRGPEGGLEVVGSELGSGWAVGAYRLSGLEATRTPSHLASATVEKPVLLLNLN